MIRITKLDKYYNKGKAAEIHVIDHTSLEFGNSGLVCILGESGSGKTTLLNTIGGLDTFQSGEITIDETAFRSYSATEFEKLRNEKFGYIFQDQYLLQEETAEYNIRLALNMYEISEEEKDSRVDYVLAAVEMKKYKKRLVSQLSGGQQQRIAIARALVKSPEIIFADEPTGSLDEANTMRIMSIIKKISKNCLVILVTHEKKIAEFFADRIIYLNNGKIEKDSAHKGDKTYHYCDDTNLYLKEYNKETFQNKNIRVNLYNNGENKEIVLNMVYTDGKLYIQHPNEAEVVFLTSENEIQMIDDVRPELNIDRIDEFEYQLDTIKNSRKPKLSFKEIWRLANSSITLLGKKQIFLILSFIITSVLLVIATADFITTKSVDKKSVVTDDSHYIEVTGRRNTTADNEDYYKSFSDIYQSFIQSMAAQDVYIGLDTSLSFGSNKYGQMKQLTYTFSDFSYVTLDHFDKKDLIYGRMPKNRNEIIIDKWLIDIFEQSDSVLKSLMPDLKNFLNLEVGSELTGQKLTIVGICDRKEPTIYIDKWKGISMAAWADKIASLQQLQEAYPGIYDDIKLKSDEVLISESEADMMKKNYQKKFQTRSSNEFKVKGTFPDEFGAAYIIDDKYYNDILAMYICNTRRFMIYTEDKKTLINYFAGNKGKFDTTFVKLVATDPYAAQMRKFQVERAVTLNSRMIVTAAMFLFSLLMLYFTMKSNVIKITNQLSVYRMLGISKGSILTAFGLEIIIITSYTMLPVVLVVSGIIKFIASMPSLQSQIVYPWLAVLLLLVFLYIMNLLIGILPIYNVIKRPPAQISERV